MLTPEELVARATARRLAAIAVTDHDSVEGLPRAIAAAGAEIEVLPGIEISSEMEGADLHVLGFFVDVTSTTLLERLRQFHAERLQRVETILGRLRELGAPVAFDAVMALAGPGVVGRPHIAEALLRAGHVTTLDDAFRRFLGAYAPAFVARPAFRTEDAIALIHDAGGVSVLAHPGASMSDSAIERLRAAGLDGIEIWHPQHGANTVLRFRALAGRLGLLESGGSDFHAVGRGADLGDLPIPFEIVGKLRQAAGAAH
ncbi:MAG: hypothetical protein A2W00_00775 [Candidatus Eisenbacteria bacterium RBG_16_71_46]|nr:MAG: hypothetical protein A2W00_00775 [Candidatus Eisenbacteria bacterium RBG_16_71_46]